MNSGTLRAPAALLSFLATAVTATASPAPQAQFVERALPSVQGVRFGMSFVDYDRDGWPDLFNNHSGQTWRNIAGPGSTRQWELQPNQTQTRIGDLHYGAYFADFNRDGWPDMATAPHVNMDGMPFNLTPLEILTGTGDDNGVQTLWIPLPGFPGGPLELRREFETHSWGDLDGDGNLDLFAPAYSKNTPPNANPGNLLFRGLGGVPGAFVDATQTTAGPNFANPVQCSCFTNLLDDCDMSCRDCRPEGSHMVDLDDDGDLDIFCNGTVYLNKSAPNSPTAQQLTSETGILFNGELDEGAILSDIDMDGDFDLVINYKSSCSNVDQMYVWGNRGDGTFYDYGPGGTQFTTPNGSGSNPTRAFGRKNGLALVDVDNDGDMDLIGRGVTRINRFIEDGNVEFREARSFAPAIPGVTPGEGVLCAFADYDHDGDLDAAMASWAQAGHFFENYSFSPSATVLRRPYLRISAMDQSSTAGAPLQTEFGAVVEVRVKNGTDTYRRKQIVASAGGYLNQHEYALTFGLLGSTPLLVQPDCEVIVDFPARAGQPRVRIDKFVNIKLASLKLGDLDTDDKRHVQVFRNGDVMIGGTMYAANNTAAIDRHMAGAQGNTGLALQSLTQGTTLGAMTDVSNSPQYIGVDFDTFAADPGAPFWISELIFDAELSDVLEGCGAQTGNIQLWDITNAAAPVAIELRTGETRADNDRTSVAVALRLAADKHYRIVAKVDRYRGSSVSLPVVTDGKVRVNGGFRYAAGGICNRNQIRPAVNPADPALLYMTFRHND